jgi:thiol-disulfide isomerase/thioredoxin
VTLGLSTSVTRMSTSHTADEELAGGGGAVEVHHDQTIVLGETRLTAEYGVSDRFGASLMLPLRLVQTDVAYIDVATGEEVTIAEAIHHRDETLVGIADPWLQGRMSIGLGDFVLDLRAGLTIPLGRTEPDPYRLGDLGLEHQHLQFGTGTWNPVAGVEIARPFGWGRLAAWGLTLQVLYQNDEGYAAGDRYAAGVTAMVNAGRRWRAVGGVEVQHESAERWNGQVPTDDGNQGRVDVLASIGAVVQMTDGIALDVSVRVPIYVNVVEAQLEYPLLASIGLTVAFGGEAEHAHAHAHAHEHGSEDVHGERGEVDWTGVDVESIADRGEAVELAPVPGKVTVIDFWAPWCAPCRILDAELAALSRAHPGRLAIRKINVVDWDSPAARRYLAPEGHDLPHVKVYGADGTIAFETSGDPRAIARAVGRVLGAE